MEFPNEILEQIFVHIPFLDLLNVQSLVCKRWRNVIVRRDFMPWKKAYFHYKMCGYEADNGHTQDLDETGDGGEYEDSSDESSPSKRIKLELTPAADFDWKLAVFFKTLQTKGSFTNGFIKSQLHLNPPVASFADGASFRDIAIARKQGNVFRLETAIPWLINFVLGEFLERDPPELDSQFDLIKLHPKFLWAQEWFAERMPELSGDGNNLASVVFLAAIAEDTWDVYKIMTSLMTPSGQSCSNRLAMEVMYCIATAFLAFKRKHGLPQRYHYNVFHAISFFESAFKSPVVSGVREAKRLTAEQMRIAQHRLVKGRTDLIKIVAFAGTGKTTSLIKMCEEHPDLKFLVIMYNKSAQLYAEEVFPRENTVCSTAHAVAFNLFGYRYKHKSTLNLKTKDIIDSSILKSRKILPLVRPKPAYGKAANDRGGHFRRAAQVLRTLENFMNSADEEITTENVPSMWPVVEDDDNDVVWIELLPGVIKAKKRTILRELPIDADERIALAEDARQIWDKMLDRNCTNIRLLRLFCLSVL